MKPHIFITRRLPVQVMTELKRRFYVGYNLKDRPLNENEIKKGIQRAHGLISMLNDSIDSKVIHAAPWLKIISNYAVGYNNIDLDAASRRGIAITNTPGVLTETTADLTWALILAVARRLPEAEKFLRSDQWTGWAPTQFLGGDIYGKTLGILGLGRIGQAVARRAAGFSMTVYYHNRHRLPQSIEQNLNVRYVSFLKLIKESDFVSLHLPWTTESHHLIDRKALSVMKPTAFLINTARGPIVNESSLIRALRQRKIAGAGFDVFEEEPRVPASLKKMNEVVLLPHIGSASRETRSRMGFMVIDNLSAFFSGKKVPNRVN